MTCLLVSVVVVVAFVLNVLVYGALWNYLIAPAFGLPMATFLQVVAGTVVTWIVSGLLKGSVTVNK